VAQALRRVEAVLQRRPEVGEHDDAPAVARWQSGTRVVSSHANGTQIESDMPAEFGGSGTRITPGWLLRAGFASCSATVIAMHAALEGIELDLLEAQASSRSDSRGVFGMADTDGMPVSAGPHDVRLDVRIAARGVDAQRLRTLVERSINCSPMGCAMREAVPVQLRIDVTSD